MIATRITTPGPYVFREYLVRDQITWGSTLIPGEFDGDDPLTMRTLSYYEHTYLYLDRQRTPAALSVRVCLQSMP